MKNMSEEMKPEWIIINGMPLSEWDKLTPIEKDRIRKAIARKEYIKRIETRTTNSGWGEGQPAQTALKSALGYVPALQTSTL